MQTKAVLPWQVMPCDQILHEIDGVVQVTSTRHYGSGGTYIEYRDRYGLPATFRRGPFEHIQKVVGQRDLF